MKIPTLTPVKSSNIEAVGHGSGGLFVRFKGGGVYRYPDASADIHKEFLKAESPGGFFRSHIRGTYKHFQVNPDG